MGIPWTPSFHARTLYLPLHPTPTTSQNGTVTLAPGITGRSYPAAQPAIPVLQSTMLITWREDGWTMNLYGVGLSSQDVVSVPDRSLHPCAVRTCRALMDEQRSRWDQTPPPSPPTSGAGPVM